MAPSSSFSSPPRVALIVGAGSNIGASLVKGFLTAGYRVAAVSRSATPKFGSSQPLDGANAHNYHAIQADASDPATVRGIFATLASAKRDWPFPSVVVWNAATMTPPPETDAGNPLAVPLEALDQDLGLMVTGPYVAAQTAVEVWKKQKTEGSRKGTFIMTGNMLPRQILPVPRMVTLGMGKSGGNFWVGLADAVFKEEGIRFFFTDERSVEGGISAPPKGKSHARFYLRLTEDDGVPSYATFVDGEYREFFP